MRSTLRHGALALALLGGAALLAAPAQAADIGEEGDFGGTYSYIGPGVSSEPEPEVLIVPGYAPDAYAEPDAYDAPDVAVAPLYEPEAYAAPDVAVAPPYEAEEYVAPDVEYAPPAEAYAPPAEYVRPPEGDLAVLAPGAALVIGGD